MQARLWRSEALSRRQPPGNEKHRLLPPISWLFSLFAPVASSFGTLRFYCLLLRQLLHFSNTTCEPCPVCAFALSDVRQDTNATLLCIRLSCSFFHYLSQLPPLQPTPRRLLTLG